MELAGGREKERDVERECERRRERERNEKVEDMKTKSWASFVCNTLESN